MRLDVSHCPDLTMARGTISRLDHATDTRLHCLAGSVWITVDGDPKDVVIEAGESWVVPGPHRVIAQAMRPSRLRFESGPACTPLVEPMRLHLGATTARRGAVPDPAYA